MNTYTYDDGVYSFEGSVSVETTDSWAAPWRVQVAQAGFYPYLTDSVAKTCSGVRLTFRTDSAQIVLDFEPFGEAAKFDLFVDGGSVETKTAEAGTEQICFASLGSNEKLVEIWLDPSRELRLRSVAVDEQARIVRAECQQPRWIHYGSSISHAKAGHSPSQIWPAIVARKMGLHLTSLGFGGNCVFEPMVGRLIRDLPADIITLKLGINVHGGALSVRTFSPNVIGLIALIREKHLHTPLTIVSPIYSPPREKTRAVPQGLSLQEMRATLQDIVETCKGYGDTNIRHVDGLSIFGPDHIQFMPDELHPDGDGQYQLAENFISNVLTH